MTRNIFKEYINLDIKTDEDYRLFISEFRGNNPEIQGLGNRELTTAIEQGYRLICESEKRGINLASEYDKCYPEKLKNELNRPIIINYLGDIQILDKLNSVAIIGTRSATQESLKTSRLLGEVIGSKSINVLSGLALGCDTEAHYGAVSVKGKTTAVLASGLDSISPRSNRNLAQEMVDTGGLLLSEYLVGTKAMKGFYVQRDKLQATLSNSIITVQTKIDGGSMHASNEGLKLKRNVAVMDFNIDDPDFNGNLHLINKGAYRLNIDKLDEFLNYQSQTRDAQKTQLKLF